MLVAAPELLGTGIGTRVPAGDGDAPDLAAWLHIDEAGQVTVYTGKVEIGQNIRTSLSQTVADELRVPVTSVTMVMADTERDAVRHGHVRIADDAADGAAARTAAATAREMLIDQAAARWQIARSGARRAATAGSCRPTADRCRTAS